MEIQTEEIVEEERWSQHPPALNFHHGEGQEPEPELVAQHLRGSGGGKQVENAVLFYSLNLLVLYDLYFFA